MDGITELKSVFNPFSGAPVFYTDITTSTMVLARNYIKDKNQKMEVQSGTVFSAGFQTAGRGRMEGRKWVGEAKQNLAFTVILGKNEPGTASFPLPLTSGLGLAFYFENEHLINPKIKWPNDILVGGKKISGIIAENTKDFFLLGVGININQMYFHGDLKDQATSLTLEKGKLFNLEAEFSAVLSFLRRALSVDRKCGEVEKRLYSLGRRIVFVPGDPGKEKPLEGVLSGIDNQGLLLLDVDGEGVLKAASGEINYRDFQ